MEWQIIDSGKKPPHEIMQKDAELLANLATSIQPVLHLYEWEGDCLTYGYFTDPFQYLHAQAIQHYQLKMARRPTGGGIIFHLTDFAFSVLVPATHPAFSLNTLENYAFINRKVIQAISSLAECQLKLELLTQGWLKADSSCETFCMAHPTQYDIIVGGKKIGGAAQRRTKYGYLHQGSIALTLPPLHMLQDVLKDKWVLEAMQRHTYVMADQLELADLRRAIKQQLITVMKSE